MFCLVRILCLGIASRGVHLFKYFLNLCIFTRYLFFFFWWMMNSFLTSFIADKKFNAKCNCFSFANNHFFLFGSLWRCLPRIQEFRQHVYSINTCLFCWALPGTQWDLIIWKFKSLLCFEKFKNVIGSTISCPTSVAFCPGTPIFPF